MFKVGDWVVLKVNVHGYPELALKVHTITFVDRGIAVINNEFYFKHDELQHATPEEIKLGHRIDQYIIPGGEGKTDSLEVLRDCDTSPNCKKYKERVGENDK